LRRIKLRKSSARTIMIGPLALLLIPSVKDLEELETPMKNLESSHN
jgi:hypothetical protein